MFLTLPACPTPRSGQLRIRETELTNLNSLHTNTKAQLEKRVSELEAKNTKLVEQNKTLELRRHFDMEGFVADVSNLRKMLSSIERKLHEMRLVERCVGRFDECGMCGVSMTHTHPV